MLNVTSRTRLILTRSNALCLVMLALLTTSLPLVRSAPPANAKSDKRKATVPPEEKVSKDNQKLPGQLVLGVFLRGREWFQGGMPLILVDPNTGKWKQLLERGSSARISPDGATLAFQKGGNIWNTDTKAAENPGLISKSSGIPVWSPDGKQIIATSVIKDPDNPKKLRHNTWRFNANGSGRVPVPLPEGHYVIDWSSNGKWLLTEKKSEVFVVRLNGKNLRRLFKSNGSARFSPDGQRVVYEEQHDGTLHLIDVDGKNKRLFYDAPAHTFVIGPVWSPDGKTIVCTLMDYTVSADGTDVLYADPEKSHPRLIFIDVKTREERILELPQQGKLKVWPVNGWLDWR